MTDTATDTDEREWVIYDVTPGAGRYPIARVMAASGRAALAAAPDTWEDAGYDDVGESMTASYLAICPATGEEEEVDVLLITSRVRVCADGAPHVWCGDADIPGTGTRPGRVGGADHYRCAVCGAHREVQVHGYDPRSPDADIVDDGDVADFATLHAWNRAEMISARVGLIARGHGHAWHVLRRDADGPVRLVGVYRDRDRAAAVADADADADAWRLRRVDRRGGAPRRGGDAAWLAALP